jgi:hypothetical protein
LPPLDLAANNTIGAPGTATSGIITMGGTADCVTSVLP